MNRKKRGSVEVNPQTAVRQSRTALVFVCIWLDELEKQKNEKEAKSNVVRLADKSALYPPRKGVLSPPGSQHSSAVTKASDTHSHASTLAKMLFRRAVLSQALLLPCRQTNSSSVFRCVRHDRTDTH